jgi:leucyl/phenylalanyl-tRNA--protein transferase
MQLTILDPHNPRQDFPSITKAMTDPDGLLAAGGCLSKKRLLKAYRLGIFPWYSPGEPILWWSPNPRLVLFPEQLKVSRSLRKTMRKSSFTFTIDRAFRQVITACAKPRSYSEGTWISDEMQQAYYRLHLSGYAHSAEAWLNGELVGGLYGIAIGKVFFGESMFHTCTDASKVVFVNLVEQLKLWDYQVIDCQVHSEHLASLGAINCERSEFISLLNQYCDEPANINAWKQT